MAKAQALFDEGVRLYNLGRYREACPKFESSLDLVAGVGTRGKLAECYERLGKTASAWRLYREVERLAKQTGDRLRQRVAAERANALQTRVARLVIEPGPSARLTGFAITANGLPVAPREYGMERIVDPGNYTIVAKAPGHETWAGSVRVREGDQITVEVHPLGAYRSSAMRTASLGFIGVGVVGMVGGGGYFGARARSQWHSAFENGHCDQQTLECDAVGLERSRAAKRSANWANLTVGVGLASSVAGAILFLRSRPNGPERTRTGITTVAPELFGNGAVVTVQGRF